MNVNKIIFLLFVSTGYLFPDSADTKIVALLQIRNEREVVEQCLRMLSLYADGIVVLDDASNDNTVQIIQSLMGELPIEEIVQNEVSAWQNGSERDNREKLLIAGRRAGGTHFIVLDADEMFSALCLQGDWLRKKLLQLKPGQTLRLPTIHQWNDLYAYRNDAQCNPTLLKWRRVYAFADDGVCTYDDNQSWHGSACIHVSREPEKMICADKVKSFYYDDVRTGVLHFKCVSLENIDVKKGWYMCLEFIRLNESGASDEQRFANAQHLNKVYNEYLYSGILSQVDNIVCAPVPAQWYAYPFFDGCAYIKPLVTKIEEIEVWFKRYGMEYFKDLDIWSIAAVQEIRGRLQSAL
ncbi:MAG TPA: glycosyltransferase family 2 protein [Candidatus Babeliales bacterium]|nr:glycosyltransferase family 2 protein [Candidatus Babeliales bacterium]